MDQFAEDDATKAAAEADKNVEAVSASEKNTGGKSTGAKPADAKAADAKNAGAAKAKTAAKA